MRSGEAIFVTDELNRQNMIMPLSTLVSAIETHLDACIKAGLPAGAPSSMAHDQCRPVGWSVPHGIYIARDKSRQVGRFWIPVTEEESAQARNLIRAFRQNHCRVQVQPHLEALESMLAKWPGETAALWHGEASGAVAPNLAATLLPEFFSPESALVDKDGLVDYGELLARTRQVEPGVFHEPKQDLLLFAHPYFRRSLSRANSLNAYVLRSFDAAAAASNVKARLRLDPDLIGVPDSVSHVIELEYWGGPKFDEDLAKIPSGVTEHKNDDPERIYSQIDKTQVWWKPPEDRRDAKGRAFQVRTFEVEELIDAPSPGLAADAFGCRYAHAEFHMAEGCISHFDGAIRAYDSEAYLERIGFRIDRAGKHAAYTKLFRLDGAIPTADWKRVLSDFFRGNRLIPEYLGAEMEGDFVPPPSEDERGPARLPDLSAYIGLTLSDLPPPSTIRIVADQQMRRDEATLPYAEIGPGSLGELMTSWADREKIGLLTAELPNANLARIALPGSPPNRKDWVEVCGALAEALDREAEIGTLEHVSLAIVWQSNGVSTTLSLAGRVPLVGALLHEALSIIRPDEPASEWAEPFRDALLRVAPELDALVAWPSDAVINGKITLDRPPTIPFRMRIPESEEAWFTALVPEQPDKNEGNAPPDAGS
jgi:hypothetical protein